MAEAIEYEEKIDNSSIQYMYPIPIKYRNRTPSIFVNRRLRNAIDLHNLHVSVNPNYQYHYEINENKYGLIFTSNQNDNNYFEILRNDLKYVYVIREPGSYLITYYFKFMYGYEEGVFTEAMSYIEEIYATLEIMTTNVKLTTPFTLNEEGILHIVEMEPEISNENYNVTRGLSIYNINMDYEKYGNFIITFKGTINLRVDDYAFFNALVSFRYSNNPKITDVMVLMDDSMYCITKLKT